MKISDFAGNNKHRDFKICHLWMEGRLTNLEISEVMGISERCVSRVVYKNRHVLKADRNWEKISRIKWLKEQLNKKGDTSRDPLDLQAELRKEIEGDDDKARGPGETKIIIIRADGVNENKTEPVSGRISVLRA